MPVDGKRVAVIGAGAAGLGAAWLLARGGYDVELFEARPAAGGHARTLDLDLPGINHPVAIDTGFIVYNTRTYPDLVSLFELLRVPQDNSSMSFAASVDMPDGSRFEWGSDTLAALFADRKNLFKPALYTMLYDMRRFNTAVYGFVEHVEKYPTSPEAAYTLGEFLSAGGYSPVFVQCYLIPMVSAVWSTPARGALAYPARTLFRFFVNHGLAQVFARPQWRTPLRRSRSYVHAVVEDMQQHGAKVHLATRVVRVERSPKGVRVFAQESPRRPTGGTFDHVVFATHAPVTLEILGDSATEDEKAILGAFKYEPNTAYVHTDDRLMPSVKSTWSAWNFVVRRGEAAESVARERTNADGNPVSPDSAPVCVSYSLNRLQNLSRNCPEMPEVFVTLNPCVPIDPSKMLAEEQYDHPQFTHDAVASQELIQTKLQGENRSWFCGAFARYGFHEDAMMTGLDVAERLSDYKVLRPWRSPTSLAINNNYKHYEYPFSSPRSFSTAYLGALTVINIVGARIHAGLRKYAARLIPDDPSVVLSDGGGLLLKFGRTSHLSAEPGLVNVRSPRLFARVTDAIHHHKELAPVAAAAFVAAELDCPSPTDITCMLRALMVAQKKGPELGHGLRGQVRLAETLLHAIVGGFEPAEAPLSSTRLLEWTSAIHSVVAPTWWSDQVRAGRAFGLPSPNGQGGQLPDSLDSHGDAHAAVNVVLDLLGNLSERTLRILEQNADAQAVVVVRDEERLSHALRTAKSCNVASRVEVVQMDLFVTRQRATGSPKQVFDLIISPAVLNACEAYFAGLSEVFGFLKQLLADNGCAELGFATCEEQRVDRKRRRGQNCDEMFCGDQGYRIWPSRDVVDAAVAAQLKLCNMTHMESAQAASDVHDVVQHMYGPMASHWSMSKTEIRQALAQFCLWEAALTCGTVERAVLVVCK